MIRFKRRNTLWLAILGVMMALVILSSSVNPVGQILLLGSFVAALIASMLDLDLGEPKQLIQSVQQRSARSRMSPQAREAVDRARDRAEYRDSLIQLLDVGIIATQSGPDGLVMRRARNISKDDDGARPFVVLVVPCQQADCTAQIRFEITDQSGKQQYVHEMEVFLRDGEMNILTEDHLPLLSNDQIAGQGDWDLRVYLDGQLLGIHTLTLSPSYVERRRRLSGNRSENQHYITGSESARQTETAPPEEEEIPLSLEQLLRNEGRRRT